MLREDTRILRFHDTPESHQQTVALKLQGYDICCPSYSGNQAVNFAVPSLNRGNSVAVDAAAFSATVRPLHPAPVQHMGVPNEAGRPRSLIREHRRRGIRRDNAAARDVLECDRGYAECADVSTSVTHRGIRICDAGKKSRNARGPTIPRSRDFSVPEHAAHSAGNVKVREGPRFPLLVSAEPKPALHSKRIAVRKREFCGLRNKFQRGEAPRRFGAFAEFRCTCSMGRRLAHTRPRASRG